jgi:SAM-dependent methyltransferase
MNTKLTQDLYIEVHNDMINKYGFTAKSLWGSRESQYVRFNKLREILLTENNYSVMDLGCGLCDFYEFLNSKGALNLRYTGFEINEKFYNAAKTRFPELDIRNGSLELLKTQENFDYVIASGIYNLGSSSEDLIELFVSQFKALYDKINIGFAVNFLSIHSEQPDSTSIYHDPINVFKKCLTNFSKYVQIDQTYLPNDFTVFVYKNKQDDF